MNNGIKTGTLVVAVLVLMVLGSSVYTVREGQHALLLRLGKLARTQTGDVRDMSPGLHFKLPFINQVQYIDTRLQTLDIKSSRIVTNEKKDVMVDYYIKWRVSNLAKYYISTGNNEFKAETLLGQQLNTGLRAEFGKRTIGELVSSDRDDVMDILKEKAEAQAKELGIAVRDVRIKGIDLPDNTRGAIYERMRADMEKIANRHRADGKREAETIQAGADAKVTVIIAKAKSAGQITMAKGQAEAAKIYASAFSKDKEFFNLYRSLKAYEKTFNNKQDVFVLNEKNQFFSYFKQASGSSRSEKTKS